jgi:outer membrane protein assembly factor BamB
MRILRLCSLLNLFEELINLTKIGTSRPVSKNLLLPILLTVLILPVWAADSAAPPEVVNYSKDWPLPNKDYGNTRALIDRDSGINSSNINSLRIAWSYPITGGSASNPLIMGDVVYFQDLKSDIVALDITSGSVKWKKDYNLSVLGPNGVAVGYGKVFAAAGYYNLVALNASSGEEIWSRNISNRDTVGIAIQPLVYDNMVYISTEAGETLSASDPAGGVGTFYAIDQATGNMIWSFDTVDSKDIWGNPDINYGGGTYMPPGIDLDTGTIYWGTSNSAPVPGTKDYPNGSSRLGPNLYTNSMLALNHSTGKLLWYTQVYPHDMFNYSLVISPILARAKINGILQNIVIGSGKTGRVYAFNSSTGAILWETLVGIHQNDQLAALPEGKTRVYPGSEGGVETAMAFAEGTIYVPVNNMYADVTPTDYFEGNFSNATGELVAIQADTGKVLWDKKFDSMAIGTATVVNDLVFTATASGTIYALKRDRGEDVWTYNAPPGVNGWPAVSGDTIVFLGGKDNLPALMAFKLPSGR